MKNIIFALLMLCSYASAKEALLTLDKDGSHHTTECGCQDECKCHDFAHVYSPIGVMGGHMHGEGEWMFSYRFKYMDMEGLRKGDKRESLSDNYRNRNGSFAALPRRMTMKMHMLGIMYGVSDDFTLGVMIPWMETSMAVQLQNGTDFRTRTDGFGDIKLNGMLKLWEEDNNSLILNLGLSLPTGNINESAITPISNGNRAQLPYPMQLGSGTVDFMPGLTYTGHTHDWAWGAQAIATLRMHRNYRGYNKGNSILMNAWVSRNITRNFATSFRLELNSWDDFEGNDDEIHPARNNTPTADNDLRGGTRVDAHIGCNYLFTDGVFKGHNLGLEIGMPVYQYIEGANLETDWTVTVGWQMTF